MIPLHFTPTIYVQNILFYHCLPCQIFYQHNVFLLKIVLFSSRMESGDKSQSLENSPSYVIIQKMTAENQKQIELNDTLLKNSSLSALMDKVSLQPRCFFKTLLHYIQMTKLFVAV